MVTKYKPQGKLITILSFFLQILWTFSIYLESVAILPQLFMISKTGEAETITSHYLFALGAYRALYIINWIYRYYFEGFYDFIAIVAGCVQTALYCDFFYLYITKGDEKKVNMQLEYYLMYIEYDSKKSSFLLCSTQITCKLSRS